MYEEYISSDEKHQEYLDRIDHEMIKNSRVKLIKMYEEQAKEYQKKLYEEKWFINKI